MLQNCYIFDLDGTIALTDSHKSPVNVPVQYLMNLIDHDPAVNFIIIVTARSGKYRKQTVKWLDENKIPYDEILMREDGDVRSDHLVKYAIFQEYIAGKYVVLGSFDDKEEDVNMWRLLHLPTFQVFP